MRVRYTGLDHRPCVARINRVKFLEDGFQRTDKLVERDDTLTGPILIVHVYRSKGGKRLVMQAPDDFDMAAAQVQLLEQGWLDLTACTVHTENLY